MPLMLEFPSMCNYNHLSYLSKQSNINVIGCVCFIWSCDYYLVCFFYSFLIRPLLFSFNYTWTPFFCQCCLNENAVSRWARKHMMYNVKWFSISQHISLRCLFFKYYTLLFYTAGCTTFYFIDSYSFFKHKL